MAQIFGSSFGISLYQSCAQLWYWPWLLSIFSLRSFEQVLAVTGDGPMNSTNLLVYYVYDRAFARLDFDYGAAATIASAYFQLRLWKSGASG
jgi:ABC-type sugar transport system permease subunit